MKKFTRTGKKVLSVFLAALMVMTAWVFVAPEAKAQSAGSYYVTITFNVDNHDNESFAAYTGKSQNGNNTVGISLFYKANNGTASSASEKVFDLGSYVGNNAAQTSHTLTCTVAGFPSEVYGYVNDDNVADKTAIRITKVQCGSSSSNLKTIWSGNARIESVKNPYYCTLTPTSSTANANDSATYVKNVDASGWKTPAPTTITWSPATLSAMTCPKTGTATQTVKVTAKDQYGVNMYDPTWSVSGSNKSTGLSMSTGNNRAESSNIQVTNSANLAGTTDSQTGTVTVTWGSGQTDKKTFTINDTTYTATFAGLKNTDGTDKDNVTANYKHGHTPTAATTASEYDIGDYHFKFSGWSPSIGEITADTTYTAQYDSNFVAADLTELNNQISNADYVKTTELWTTGSYTDESMAALESALTAAKNTRDSNPGRTQQSTVDSVAKTLKDAIDALKLKTYTVKFYNAEGLIIKTEEVVAGKAATAPASPAKNDDETYHYSFKAWDKAFNNVTSDLDVRPTYTPEAHKWQTSTTVPANCQHGAGIKKTCSVCSRVSESYDDTLGAHTKSTHYAVSKEATCTADGTGYYYCTVCGTNMGNVTIKAKGHTYDTGKVTKEASCTATGTRLHTCTSCGDTYTETLEKIPHTYAKSSTVVATCEHSAYDVMKCSVCGDTYNKYVGGIAEHNWEWTVKNATLSENGSVTGTCKNCGYTVTKEVSFDGHHYDFDNPIITEATCNADGSVVINCTDSGCTEKIAIKLNKTDIHNYTTKYTAPNCTTAGSIVNTCSVCKTSTTVETIAALGHNYGEAVVTPATCTEDGKMTYTCARCNDVKTTTIKATGHKEYVIDAIEATCNTEGRTEGKKCAVCGETIVASTVIAKKAHSFTGEVKTIAATCEADGATLTKCANCDTWKIDTIPAIGHNYKEEVVAPTCTSKGYTKHTCQNCGKVYTDNETAMISHNYVLNSDLSLAPSCEGEGVNIYVCSVCGSSKSEKVKEKGHSFGDWSTFTAATCTGEGSETRICSVCGKTEVRKVAKLGHDYSSDFTTDIAATCISAGQKSKHCSRCDAKTEVTTIQALGHDLSVTTTSATCTTSGKKVETCSRCDYEKTTIISEALGHNFVAGTPVEATCASSGYIPYTCSRNCGVAGYNVINGGASKNHNWKITSTVSHGTTTVTGSCSVCGATFSETVNSAHDFKNIQSQTPATCIESGSLTLACADENCNETFTVTLEKNENAHKSVTNTLTKASCTEAGKVVSICDDCRKVLATTEIPATGHSYTEQTEYVASTCQTKGHITFKCGNENCDSTKSVELEVNPNAHKFENPVHYNATCTTPAYDKYTCAYGCGKTYESFTGTADTAAHAWTFSTSQSGTTLTITCKCSKCDAQHTQTVEVAEGHNYNSVTVTKQPTCSAEGEMKIACDKNHKADCTASITVALPVNENAHSVKTVVTPATCTTAGTAYSYCELCNETVGETVTIAELGHNYVGGAETVKTAATCEKDGVKTVKCTRCDDTIEIAIPKLGHTWDNGTSHDADCTHSAYTTYKCSTCGETKDVVSAGAKANGHDWNDWVIVNPTNDKVGSATRTCKNCDETETVEIPAGGHRFDATQYEEVKATCTKKGSRTYTCIAHVGDEACGVSITVETDLAQHSYELKYNEKATCTTDGKVVMECSVCHDKNEVTIPAFGHTWDNGVVTVEPTHKTAGSKTYTCSTCKATREETIEKLPHEFVAGDEVLPTCKDGGKSGYIPYTCSCGETYNKITDKKIEHKWGNFKTVQTANEERCGIEKRTCSECGAVDYKITDATGDHTYEDTTTKEATCTEEGSLIRHCTNPNHTDEKDQTLPIPALGHNMVAGENVPATCEHEGYTEYTCSRDNCGFSYRIVTAAATSHTESEWTVVREATCTVDGLRKKTCTTCGEILETEDIKAKGHTEVTVNEEATCTEPGQSYTYCSVCKTITSENIVIKPANGHDWNDWEVTKKSTNTEKGLLTRVCKTDETHVETVETPAGGHTFDMNNPSEEEKATCSAEGWKLFKCTAHTGEEACGIELTVTTEKVQHEFKIVTIPASCTESGSVKISCKNCDEAFDEITLNPLGHDFSKETANVASTCNTVGYVTKQCSRCEETETTYSSTLADHSWGDLKVVQTADETHPGIKVKQCSVCNLYDYEYTLPTGDHHWNEGVITTPATCTTDGEKTYTCLADGNCACKADNKATYTEKIPAKGHKAKVELKEATCSEAGYVKAVCETCGTTLDEKTLEKKEHIYQSEVTTEPTCTTPGQKTFTCAVCGETTKAAEEIPAVPHAYVASGKYVDATCTSPKYEKYNCTYCGDEKLVKVGEASGHDTTENYVTVDEATCTKAGYSEWRCHCGALLGAKVLGPSDHTWEEVTVELPKECDGAKVTYEKCSVCDVIKADSLNITENGDHEYVVDTVTAATCTTAGKLVITCKNCKNVRAEVEIPAVGHTYDEGVLTEGTCETDGNVTFTCTREGCTDAQTGHTITKNIGKKNHNYLESGAPVAATCTSSGYQLYKCEYCNKEFKQILEAPVAAHIYEKQPTSTEPNCYQDGHYYFKCKNCDAAYDYVVSATGRHEFKSEVTQAQSCTNPESTTYTCTTVGCGYSYIKVTKSALGHSFGEWEVTKEPTETEDGEQKRSCTRDGCDEPETAPIPASVHNWGTEPVETTEDTCTEAATETYQCTGCDLCNAESGYKTYVKTVGDPLGHEVVVDYHAPTCKEDGSYKAHCSRCPATFVTETVEAKGHSFNTLVEGSYVPATCQSEGSMTFSCACGEKQTVTIPVNADAHKMVEDVENSKSKTCTEAGYKAYKCANEGCSHTYMTAVENPSSHSAKDEWTVKSPATCHSDGYAVLECKDCGAVMETKVLPADENLHNWKTVTEKADHTKSGYSYEQCENCGEMRNFVTEGLIKHDYKTIIDQKPATATENGYVTYECECGDQITLVVPASGHEFTSEVTTEPTCTEKGVRTFTCKLHENCTANYSEEIPALGHKAADVEVTPATCIAEGAAVVNCETCGDELSRVAIAKLPHTYKQTSRVEPTCHTTGSITYSCTTEGCTASYSISLNMVPHKYEYKESVAPTCLESGYDVYVCAYDGCENSFNVKTVSANGHKYQLVKETPATCNENGHRYYECKNCTGDEKAKYDYEIPATGLHSYTETVKVEPGCETAGYTYKKCANCDAVDKNSVSAIDPLGHDYSEDLGNGTFKCSRCEKTVVAQKTITDEDGTVHSFIGTITKQSTCKEKGEIAYTCQNHKNCERNFTEELPLSEHAANAESIVKTEPKCNIDGTLENGSVKIVCAVCGETITELELTASHSYKVTKVEKATCASNGKVTEVCEKCGHERVTEISMDPVAHDFKNEPDLVVAATCTTDGYAVYSCRHCDAQKYQKTIDKLNHRNTTATTVQPGCEVDGYERITCDDCGKIISETAIEKTGHKAVKVTVAATCTKGGSITTKCSVCGEILDVVLTEAKGHTWGAWVRTDEGSCKDEGSEYRECLVCHEREVRSSGIGEHHYDIIEVVEPTCENDGYTKYTCSVCGHFYIADYVPHTGHTYTSDFKVVVEPTCHSTGAKARTCKYCGQIDPDDANYVEIQELPHNYGEWVFTTDPTCENNGVKVRTCQNEGCTDKDEGHTETVVVGKLGHHYGDWTVVRDATCVMNGEKQRVCDRCGGIEKAEIAKVGHKRVADPEVPATCTKTGLTGGSHCSVCGTVFVAQKEIPMTDHMDLSGDGRCDGCGKTLEGKNGNDTCWCHRTGIAALVYGFVRIFWKIFKINQYCVCGDKHY